MRREQVDIHKLARALIALAQSEAEAQAQAQHEGQADREVRRDED